MATSHESHPLAVKPGLYIHFKGGRYEVLGLALEADKSKELAVVYRAENAPNLYYRSYENFMQFVQDAEGRTVPRFRKVE